MRTEISFVRPLSQCDLSDENLCVLVPVLHGANWYQRQESLILDT